MHVFSKRDFFDGTEHSLQVWCCLLDCYKALSRFKGCLSTILRYTELHPQTRAQQSYVHITLYLIYFNKKIENPKDGKD